MLLDRLDGVKRGATEGPLKDLIPVFLDVETWMTPEIRLGIMTLRQYLAKTHLTAMAIAIGDEEPDVYSMPDGKFLPDDEALVDVLIALALDPKYVFVAHNGAFDIRVLRFLLGLPQPQHVWCTLEGAMGAWPEMPGGYSLGNLGERLGFASDLVKIQIDLHNCTDAELLEYNKRDVKSEQELYYRQVALLPGLEQEVALRTHRQRQYSFEIDQGKLDHLMIELENQASYAEQQAEQYITSDQMKDIFNRDDGYLKSVRSKRLLDILNESMDADLNSTSLKKISPLKLARSPKVAALLTETSRVAKMLSHKRRSIIFKDISTVDVELGYMRAHTGRFSSPSVGKGLNLHNIPKHDKSIAKPVREIFRLPKTLCFVRADLSNVEYRVEGKLTNCRAVFKMFEESLGGDPFNDPYSMAWKSMTAQKINKADPIRQVAKAAVLGLGFCMGPTGYCRGSLLTALANKKSGITEDVLRKIVIDLGWKMPDNNGVKRITDDLGCSIIPALASYHIHRVFNEAHPEFSRVADWLVRVVTNVSSAPTKSDAKYSIDNGYKLLAAPDRNMIGLEVDDDETFFTPSIRVRCGDWPRTVCWREPKLRPTVFLGGATDHRLTILKSTKQFKPFTRQLAIENVTQAAARNGLCWAVGELEKEGFPDVLHVHDEILIITPRNRESILAARDAMVRIIGPNGRHPMGWAVLIKPSEISVTESMWEAEEDVDPKKGDRFGKIERNEPGCLDNLP